MAKKKEKVLSLAEAAAGIVHLLRTGQAFLIPHEGVNLIVNNTTGEAFRMTEEIMEYMIDNELIELSVVEMN